MAMVVLARGVEMVMVLWFLLGILTSWFANLEYELLRSFSAGFVWTGNSSHLCGFWLDFPFLVRMTPAPPERASTFRDVPARSGIKTVPTMVLGKLSIIASLTIAWDKVPNCLACGISYATRAHGSVRICAWRLSSHASKWGSLCDWCETAVSV